MTLFSGIDHDMVEAARHRENYANGDPDPEDPGPQDGPGHPLESEVEHAPTPIRTTQQGPTGAARLPVRLDTVEPVAPEPLLAGRLAPRAHTILFGDGDIGKGTLACHWALELVRQGLTVLVVDYESHRDEWTWRLDGLGGLEGRAGVYHVAPIEAGWRGALWEHLEVMRAAIEATGADVVIVDSLAVACRGYDPKDDATASSYCAAANGLNVSVLSIAHVTKAGGGKWPYGSVFWHNLARVTWNMSAHQLGRLLRCRKSNAYEKPRLQMVTITWLDGRLGEVWEKPYAEALSDAVLDILSDTPKTRAEIDTALEEMRDEDDEPVKKNNVKVVLGRLRRRGDIALEGDRWCRL